MINDDMRLREIYINQETMKIEIDLLEYIGNFAVIVCEGKAKLTRLPKHGETKIITHQGKVKRVKYDEGEEFWKKSLNTLDYCYHSYS